LISRRVCLGAVAPEPESGVSQPKIRSSQVHEEGELLAAYAELVEDGGAFPRTPPADREMLRSAWINGATTVQVARSADGRLAGAYLLRPA
jgi:hypothetical protein